MLGFEGETGFLAIWLGTMVLAGVAGGLLAGLLGVGGGIVIVPVLYHLMASLDVDEGVRMHVAVGTSLATIILTSAISVRSHYKRGAVDLDLLRSWGPGVFVGVVVGTLLAGIVSGEMLIAVFAVIALLVAANMLFRRNGTQIADGFPNQPVKVLVATVVGTLSAMMGIGGGTLSVPILTATGFDIRRAVGTAAATGLIISIPGTLGFILSGIGEPGRPPASFGYVDMIAAATLVPLTMTMAPMGARIAHTIPRRSLQMCFAIFLVLTSARMFYDLFS